MKLRHVVSVCLLLALATCTPSGKVVEPVETPSPELSAIDSLMWRQPDSALAVMLDYFAGRDAMNASPENVTDTRIFFDAKRFNSTFCVSLRPKKRTKAMLNTCKSLIINIIRGGVNLRSSLFVHTIQGDAGRHCLGFFLPESEILKS